MQSYYKKIIVSIITWEARLVLKKYKPRIVAVTGSVGKTSTKDALFTVLSQFFYVRKSEKSFNSDTGIPLSILGVPNGWNDPVTWFINILKGLWLIIYPHAYPKWLVLEVGADKPNDIKSVSKWLKPYAVVMTRFPDVPVHIEFFESREHVIEEKSSLALALGKNDLLLLNADDDAVFDLAGKVVAPVLSYGFSERAEFRASHFELSYDKKNNVLTGVTWTLAIGGKEYPVTMDHVVSTNHVYAVLPALALAHHEGCDIEKAIAVVKNYQTPPGRLSLISGKKNAILIDDTYNSSPAACEAALLVLKSIKAKGRKIAVLGDMLELGKHTISAHKDIGKLAAESCDLLITVGIRSEHIRDAAFTYGLGKEKVRHFPDTLLALEFLEQQLQENDVILIKGSQGVRLERIVKALMENPEDAPKLLVRQEREWLAKK